MKIFNKIKKSSPFNIIISVCGIMLLLSVSVLFGYSISTGGLVVSNSKQNVDSYYMVELDCFEEYHSALEFALSVQAKGGAGFIRFDDGFKVFSSAYISYEDAKEVLKKQSEYQNAKIYTLFLASFDRDNGLDEQVNKIIKNNIISFKYVIENVTTLLMKLDKNEIDKTKFKQNLTIVKEEIELQIEKFQDVFSQSRTMYKYKSYLNEFLDEINKMLNLEDNGIAFASLCHYSQISLIYCLDKILQLV